MANIQKFGDALSSIGQALMMTDPRYAPVVEQMKRQQMLEQEFAQEQDDRRRALEKESALKSFAASLQSGQPINLESALAQYGAASGDPSIMLNYLMQQNDPARKLQLQSAQLALQQAQNEQQRQSALQQYAAQLPELMRGTGAVPSTPGIMGPQQPRAGITPEQALLGLAQRDSSFLPSALEQLAKPAPERKTAQDVNGVLRYVDSGQPVFPGIEAPEKPPETTGLPEGYKWENGKAVPIEGVTPGAVKPTAETEKARKLAEEALASLDIAKKEIYDETGSVRRARLWASYSIPIPAMSNPTIQFGGARDISQPIERAIMNAIYLKSGATASPKEIESYKMQYMPSKYDSDTQIKNKLDSLEMFLKSNAPNFEQNVAASSPKVKFLGFEDQ